MYLNTEYETVQRENSASQFGRGVEEGERREGILFLPFLSPFPLPPASYVATICSATMARYQCQNYVCLDVFKFILNLKCLS